MSFRSTRGSRSRSSSFSAGALAVAGLALSVSASACARDEGAMPASMLQLDLAAQDSRGVAFATAVRTASYVEGESGDPASRTRAEISVFGASGGCVTRIENARDAMEPLWIDDGGLVVRVSETSGATNAPAKFRRASLDGALSDATTSGAETLPRALGESAPRFVFFDGHVHERGADGAWTKLGKPAPAELGDARVAGLSQGAAQLDDAGRLYAVSTPDGTGLGSRSIAPRTTQAAPVDVDAEIRIFASDGALVARATVPATSYGIPAAVVASGGVVVLDRNAHLRRFAADGASIYDVEIPKDGYHYLAVSADGSTTVAEWTYGDLVVLRYAPDGTKLWDRKLGDGQAPKIQALADGSTSLIMTQVVEDPSTGKLEGGALRLRLDARGEITARDVCVPAAR